MRYNIENILGVKLNERFKIDKYKDLYFYFTECGLHAEGGKECNIDTTVIVNELVFNEVHIVLDDPKCGQRLYYISDTENETVEFILFNPKSLLHLLALKEGLLFRTKDEALANVDLMDKKYRDLIESK